MSKELTKRQRELLEKLEEFVEKKGHFASYGHMADALKCSRTNIRQLVKPLLRKGYIVSTPGIANSLRPENLRLVLGGKNRPTA